jgi:hypothetical protein
MPHALLAVVRCITACPCSSCVLTSAAGVALPAGTAPAQCSLQLSCWQTKSIGVCRSLCTVLVTMQNTPASARPDGHCSKCPTASLNSSSSGSRHRSLGRAIKGLKEACSLTNDLRLPNPAAGTAAVACITVMSHTNVMDIKVEHHRSTGRAVSGLGEGLQLHQGGSTSCPQPEQTPDAARTHTSAAHQAMRQCSRHPQASTIW